MSADLRATNLLRVSQFSRMSSNRQPAEFLQRPRRCSRYPENRFHIALSAPLADDEWAGQTGFIHDVLRREQLLQHANPKAPSITSAARR